MDDQKLKRHVLAKRLLRRCSPILRGVAHEENLTPRHRATDLLDDIDLFLDAEPFADKRTPCEEALFEVRKVRATLDALINDGEPHEMGGPFFDGRWLLSALDAALKEAPHA